MHKRRAKRPEVNMKLNTMMPAIRRGLSRTRKARGSHHFGAAPRSLAVAPTLSREEFRQAVIEVLG